MCPILPYCTVVPCYYYPSFVGSWRSHPSMQCPLPPSLKLSSVRLCQAWIFLCLLIGRDPASLHHYSLFHVWLADNTVLLVLICLVKRVAISLLSTTPHRHSSSLHRYFGRQICTMTSFFAPRRNEHAVTLNTPFHHLQPSMCQTLSVRIPCGTPIPRAGGFFFFFF
jgi:hypothetical protein